MQQTLKELLGEQQASRYQKIISPQEAISWQVFTPKNNSGEVPGVMVYVSPTKSGGIDPRWRTVMDEQNIIYIAANDSGNNVRVDRRMVLAIMALKALAKQHPFTMDRIIVSGFSGGGRTASMLASQYPDLFSGTLYICGVDFWEKRTTPNVERLIQNRFVFLTGSRDFNRDETRKIHRSYLKAGAKHSKLMVIPGMSHQLPDGEALKEALLFLSGENPLEI